MAQRRLHAKPMLRRLHCWLQTQRARHLPKGKFAKAVNYALNHWEALRRYCEAGYLEIDNNYSERKMRPIALGRKNYLFTGSECAREAAEIFYSEDTNNALKAYEKRKLKQDIEEQETKRIIKQNEGEYFALQKSEMTKDRLRNMKRRRHIEKEEKGAVCEYAYQGDYNRVKKYVESGRGGL